jgi:isopentenyl diphosphate isomerase/L-lactate dehydrogenase-like FMN-dependent dehydrogenase
VASSAKDALNVFELQQVSKLNIPPAHFGYLETGVDGEATLAGNRDAFSAWKLRARRLVDVTTVDLSTEILGHKIATPIVLSPVSSQRAFHPEGEEAVAKATQTLPHIFTLSTLASTAVEAVVKLAGGPVWFQLYPSPDFEIAKHLIGRAEAAGCPTLVLTVDLPYLSNRETELRAGRQDTRHCDACHVGTGLQRIMARKPMFDGLDRSKISSLLAPNMSWDFIERVRGATKMKIVLKGIVTHEDAELAVKSGVDGIWVSNHGGRAEESGRGTLHSLVEVAQANRGRLPIVIDGGIRRGTDIIKALALGATVAAIGRPYIYGLGAFGQAGVERVLTILRDEMKLAMAALGLTAVQKVSLDSVVRE